MYPDFQLLGTPECISFLEILQDLYLMDTTSCDRFVSHRSDFGHLTSVTGKGISVCA